MPFGNQESLVKIYTSLRRYRKFFSTCVRELSTRRAARNTGHHNVKGEFEQSLKELDYEYVDLLLMHWPQAFVVGTLRFETDSVDLLNYSNWQDRVGRSSLHVQMNLQHTSIHGRIWRSYSKLVHFGSRNHNKAYYTNCEPRRESQEHRHFQLWCPAH